MRVFRFLGLLGLATVLGTLAACGSGEGDDADDFRAPAPADDARRDVGDASACRGNPKGEAKGPFPRELVELCLEFSAPGKTSEAACRSASWDCAFHADLVRARDERRQLSEEARKEGGGDAPSKFERVMKHILHWEGGCSDHPTDNGGRTYKGITTARARANGWTGDVCAMPTSRVLGIYRRDYWSPDAKKQPWPLDLAVMNTAVNSGPGKATEFLARLGRSGPSGSARAKARWFVDQQTAYYRDIVARNPGQGVFLQGWLNRSKYMQDVIAGRRASAWEFPRVATAWSLAPTPLVSAGNGTPSP